MADGDDVSLKSLGEGLVCGAFRLCEDGFKDDKNLFVAVLIEVEGELIYTFLALILFLLCATSRPQLVIFLKQTLDSPHRCLRIY